MSDTLLQHPGWKRSGSVLKERDKVKVNKTRDLALASMARDNPPASSMTAAMRGKVGSDSEFEI